MAQPTIANNLMDGYDKSITSFVSQRLAEDKLVNFYDFPENHLETIKAHTILTNYKPKQLNFAELMKPAEQPEMMPPPKVLMEFRSKESTLMDAPTSLCGESLNETKSYKMAMLAGLAGTALIGASRASTRFPTARKIAVIAGIAINIIAATYVIYNCKLNWKEEGKKQLNKVKTLTSKILNVCKNFFKTQPSEEKQAVFNQRGDPAKV